MEYLYHYYDESTGPFRNLTDLPPTEAENMLQTIRQLKKGFASQRSMDYLAIRRSLESKARELFIRKGGMPVRSCPHYMTLGKCPWLAGWYPSGRVLQYALADFDPGSISFTYGDLFPAMRFQDGKPYRNQVYTVDEIFLVINQFGMPQQWNPLGDQGPERYIEVQVWDDSPLRLPGIRSSE
ncbi:hypothetical protein [Paenibacillus nasutitermitis]|uniref:Uncharacterized protein n=1 Tax=Paenibacillus nasutitermitis TaxID=1652958 RepID=A0A916ZEF1_9BACL|nr:hypothetical protein [Paenibacillus nasutitermitis]GGD92073.1 hypothetical protein GCM10010911_58390 [Paenibacillus nasutitermitis]